MPPGKYSIVELSSDSIIGLSCTTTLTPASSSVVGLTTTSVVGLTTTSIVGLSSTSLVSLTSTSPPTIATSASIASVVATTSGGMLQATNSSRRGLKVYNQGTSPALIAYTTSVSSSNYSFQLNATDYWEMALPINTVGMSVAVSSTLTGGTATILVTEET